jgi:molybdopterin-guanine dinucleotide biosynthesis protein A
LAGILAALDWTASALPAVTWVATVPGDGPFPPRDLVARLQSARAREGAVMACAGSGGWTHPVAALWPVSLRDALRHAVAEEGIRKIDTFTGRYACAVEEWPVSPVDPFFNVNTPEDLAEANRLAALYPEL